MKAGEMDERMSNLPCDTFTGNKSLIADSLKNGEEKNFTHHA